MRVDLDVTRKTIAGAIAMARAQKPAYDELCTLLEPLFLLQAEVFQVLQLESVSSSVSEVESKWKEGVPLLKRWDFPLDISSSETLLNGVKPHLPAANPPLTSASQALTRALEMYPARKRAIWESFLQHEFEPWEEWMDTRETDAAALLFLARSCLRPSVEWDGAGPLGEVSRSRELAAGVLPRLRFAPFPALSGGGRRTESPLFLVRHILGPLQASVPVLRQPASRLARVSLRRRGTPEPHSVLSVVQTLFQTHGRERTGRSSLWPARRMDHSPSRHPGTTCRLAAATLTFTCCLRLRPQMMSVNPVRQRALQIGVSSAATAERPQQFQRRGSSRTPMQFTSPAPAFPLRGTGNLGRPLCIHV